ncbi:hypothetical protein E1287_42440 [Actinomadura sp. KC06]|uniref:hypothetical protein n=1 Tax=Actinomadura sp. KC06 TaxID=2530369 RepID=UPI00104EBC20|nr:hypothetical protein [Actinomadura sp. KC06]TDD15031.1 hypothetical protein E1287_42440 [Actinomadura sp. KC06]
MRITHRPVIALGALVIAAAAAVGPAAGAEARSGTNTSSTVAAGSLYAWESAHPSGPPDMIFEGVGCRNTGGRYNAWRAFERGTAEVWALFDGPHCDGFIAIVNPRPEPQAVPGIESVQRLR